MWKVVCPVAWIFLQSCSTTKQAVAVDNKQSLRVAFVNFFNDENLPSTKESAQNRSERVQKIIAGFVPKKPDVVFFTEALGPCREDKVFLNPLLDVPQLSKALQVSQDHLFIYRTKRVKFVLDPDVECEYSGFVSVKPIVGQSKRELPDKTWLSSIELEGKLLFVGIQMSVTEKEPKKQEILAIAEEVRNFRNANGQKDETVFLFIDLNGASEKSLSPLKTDFNFTKVHEVDGDVFLVTGKFKSGNLKPLFNSKGKDRLTDKGGIFSRVIF